MHANKEVIESVANTIAMAPHCHEYWDRALFALQPGPVNDDKTKMIVKFYWLQPQGSLPPGSTLELPDDVPDSYLLEPIIMPVTWLAAGETTRLGCRSPISSYSTQTPTASFLLDRR